ncbi:hypothetical protein ABT124_15680 [Streptomyces sp. NPDC001982]|uniref:hypothetical protein n=1 Tax=Streptomyces sp. NPDC001982 TaxID=3154405 RepID=UPI0033234AA0
MLEAALAALAAAAGTAVVQAAGTAAGTQAWDGFRSRVARFLGRGDQTREQAELERLNQTAAVLEAASTEEAELVRIRQEASWQTRFETLLENLTDEERQQVAAQLRALVSEHANKAGSVSAGDGGVAVGGNVDIRADRAGVAAVSMGKVTTGNGNPPQPGAPQG